MTRDAVRLADPPCLVELAGRRAPSGPAAPRSAAARAAPRARGRRRSAPRARRRGSPRRRRRRPSPDRCTIGTSRRRYSRARAGPSAGGQPDRRPTGIVEDVPAVDDVAGEADDEPAEPGPARRLVLDQDDEERDRGRDAAEDREERASRRRPRAGSGAPVQSRSSSVAGNMRSRTIEACATVNEKRRAERVERADEVDVARQEDRDRGDAREEDEREPRRLEARVQAAEDLRQLPVAGHRVRDPRRTDDAGVRRDEEDRRGEHADVDLERRRAARLPGRGSRPRRAPGRSRSRPPPAAARAASSARRRSARPAAPRAPRRAA